jgi:hypothetical protein
MSDCIRYDILILVYTVSTRLSYAHAFLLNPKLNSWPTASEKMTDGRRQWSPSLKATYGSLYAKVSCLLREADTMGLIAMGAPADEYDPEISTILPRLCEARAVDDVQRIVHEECMRWFGTDLIGPIADYAAVAEKIWGTWLDCGQGA